ncbi:MAG: hypothetical protein HY207_11330 [Nitrospirae bacterium]|nr:hypothetical protein [Nitrospirota bacterium]
MCERVDLDSEASTQLQVVVPKPIYDELAGVLSQTEINRTVVECLKDSLRKLRFHRDLKRTAQRKKS